MQEIYLIAAFFFAGVIAGMALMTRAHTNDLKKVFKEKNDDTL